MKSTSCQHRAWAPSKTLLEPGCRWKPFWPPFWLIFGPPEPLKIMLSLWRGAILVENSKTRPGLQNRAQKAPKIEAKSLPGGFKMASKRVSKKASMLDPILKLFLSILEAPGGRGRSVKMASKIASKTALALKLGLPTPGRPPGAHFDPLGPRFWSLRELIFEASAASSAAWPEARSPRSAWLTNGGRRCWRSHSQYNNSNMLPQTSQ